MPTSTRISLRQEIASKLYGSDTFLTGTATAAGTTSTMVDTKLISTVAGSNQYVGYWLYCDSTTASAAPEGEARMVSQYAPSTGTLTVDPIFTVALGTGTAATYELHPVLHPDRLDEAINWAQEFGSNEALAAVSDDDATTSDFLDRDLLIQGVLYRVKQGWSHDPSLSVARRVELTEQWQGHWEAFNTGLDLLGYRRPALVAAGG